MSNDVPEGSSGAPGGFGPGSRIAAYVLAEQAGAGGMAVVFRAHDTRLDRQVALKIMSPAFAADEAFRLRFIRESRAAAAVDDPHIIPVYEAGEENGVLYIAMRYVRGGDVRSLLTHSGPLPPARVAGIITQVASALDAAHERGLVHRDVKPANMLLDAPPGSGKPDHVYLSDFGLSKGTLATSGITGTGQFMGTVDYISPEQIEGKPVDGQADQYALACAAFELLTGAPPFRRDEAMAVMYAQLSEPPPAATSRRPDLPPAVDAVFARALAKAPRDRWSDCQGFARELGAALGIASYDSGEQAGPASGADQGDGEGPGSRPGSGGSAARPPTRVLIRRDAGSGPEATVADAGTGEQEPQAGSRGPRTRNLPSGPPQPQDAVTETHSASGAGAWPGAVPAPKRPAWRSPAVLAGTLAVLLALGGGGAYLTRPKPAAKAAVAAFLSPPGCSTAVAAGRTLALPTRTVKLRYGNPFGVAVSRDGRYVFASNPATLSVLIMGPGQTAVAQNDYYVVSSGEQAKGLALTSDGRYVAIAVGNQVNVQGTAPAEQGASTANAANLVVPGVRPVTDANDVAISPGDRYVFVAMTNSDELAVFNLAEALTRGQTQPGVFVGTIRLGFRPTQMAVSPDGRWLYVVSQGKARPAVPGPGEGLLSVLNVRTLETRPASALVAQATAGCSPAGVAVSPDGTTVWVAARGSNELLGFSAATLRTGSPHALTARVRVGQTPTAVIPVDGGREVVVADANLTGQPGADNLAVVSAAALARKPALLGYIPSGRAPFRFALSASGRYLYVSDSRAAQIQIIDVAALPARARG